MRKGLLVLVLVMGILCTACASVSYNGSRMGNDSQLNMEFKMFNTTDSQDLKLTKGDIVRFEIVNQSGDISISLGQEGKPPIYEGRRLPTSVFQVSVEENGTYTVFVTGRRAKGSVYITREQEDSESDETGSASSIDFSETEGEDG